MKPQAIIANMFVAISLVALLISPLYFAKNFSQVAGVKTQSRYLLISQTDRFPNMTFTQSSNTYQVSFTKQNQPQAFLGVFIITNPTQSPQKYTINTQSSQTKIFFGEDIDNLENSIILPSESTAPISILAKSAFPTELVDFSLN